MSQDESRIERPSIFPNARTDVAKGTPGLWVGAIAAVLSGLVTWIWLAGGITATVTPSPAAGAALVSELAQVNDRDIDGAMTTMTGSAAFLARFKERREGCPLPLAWVSLVRAPGQPPGKIRLRSGGYLSPIFDLSDVPMRIAIPYPAPYETGRGTLTAISAGGNAMVSLIPPWRVSEKGGGARDVRWRAGSRCTRPNG